MDQLKTWAQKNECREKPSTSSQPAPTLDGREVGSSTPIVTSRPSLRGGQLLRDSEVRVERGAGILRQPCYCSIQHMFSNGVLLHQPWWNIQHWLVGGNQGFGSHLFIVPLILGISSSQLTNSYFSEGWRKTTNQLSSMMFPSNLPSIGNSQMRTMVLVYLPT